MDMYDSIFAPHGILNEQVARQIFEILPEGGPLILILDKEGNRWPSSTEKFSELNIDETFLRDLCAKIDDGAEPVITQINDCSMIGSELATEQTKCGYVVIALAGYSPESTLINVDLIEILLNQMSLIAKLIEKNSRLYELQIKHFAQYSNSPPPLN